MFTFPKLIYCFIKNFYYLNTPHYPAVAKLGQPLTGSFVVISIINEKQTKTAQVSLSCILSEEKPLSNQTKPDNIKNGLGD